MKRWGSPGLFLVIVALRWIVLGGSGCVSSFVPFGISLKGRSGKRWYALSLALDAASRWANRSAVFATGSVWTAVTFCRSLRNVPSDGGEACNVRCSVARSWMIRRRKSSEREGGLERWEKARGRCGVWRVALGSSSRVWLRILVGRGDALLFSSERLSERGEV